MSLVAYAVSDESENEKEEESSGEFLQKIIEGKSKMTFLKSPASKKYTQTMKMIGKDFIIKNKNSLEKPNTQTIKISIPSLLEFDNADRDEGNRAEIKKTVKASGLFAILPPPKSTALSNRSFIPNVINRNPQTSLKPKGRLPRKAHTVDESESDDDTDTVEPFDEKVWHEVCAPKRKRMLPKTRMHYNGLDNEAFKKLLVGSSKVRRDNIKLNRINEEEVLSNSKSWLMKSLTDPEMAERRRIEEGQRENGACRNKHRITYLAKQAKVNEQKLQMQWSQSKYNRRLSKSKYGF